MIQPSALGELILDSAACPVLLAWREGNLQPVVSRALLVRYLRLLKNLGLPSRTARWWGWWLGSAGKTLILNDPEPIPDLSELCAHLAESSDALGVLHRSGLVPPDAAAVSTEVQWFDPPALLKQLSQIAH